MESILKSLVIICICGIQIITTAPIPSEEFSHSLPMEEADIYHVFWKYDESTITFEVHVKTKGYIGFGISGTGGMKDSDIVIGWVDGDGKPYLHDRYATQSGFEPKIDSDQDWELLAGSETNTHTILKFRRLLTGCPPQDMPITRGTSRLIWCYHGDDPESPSLDVTAFSTLGLPYHGTNQRGSRSVQLIGVPRSTSPLPSGTWSIELRNKNVSVKGGQDTTYWCQGVQIPAKADNHYIIKLEPIIEEGNEGLVHHITLNLCNGWVAEDFDTRGIYCFNAFMPERENCTQTFFAWAIGAEEFDLPKDIGFPIEGNSYLLMETHYDNQDLRTGVLDNSGLRLWVTPVKPRYESSTMLAGVGTNKLLVVPPKNKRFITQGYCSADCLTQGLEDSNFEEINVFAVLLHSHLLGRSLRVRHFRKNAELSPLIEDNSYDFNFQEVRRLPKEIKIKKGDSLIIECEYTTTQRDEITMGGLATTDEMCLAYLLYYPKTNLSLCLSFMEQTTYYQFITSYDSDSGKIKYNLDWTKDEDQKRFQDAIITSKKNEYCNMGNKMFFKALVETPQLPINQSFAECPRYSTASCHGVISWIILSFTLMAYCF